MAVFLSRRADSSCRPAVYELRQSRTIRGVLERSAGSHRALYRLDTHTLLHALLHAFLHARLTNSSQRTEYTLLRPTEPRKRVIVMRRKSYL